MEINTIIQIIEAIGLVIAASTAIARLTPTSKDDTIVEKIRRIFEGISNMFLKNR